MRTKKLKAKSGQITYVEVGEKNNYPFAFWVRAGVVHIYQTQPKDYEIHIIDNAITTKQE